MRILSLALDNLDQRFTSAPSSPLASSSSSVERPMRPQIFAPALRAHFRWLVRIVLGPDKSLESAW